MLGSSDKSSDGASDGRHLGFRNSASSVLYLTWLHWCMTEQDRVVMAPVNVCDWHDVCQFFRVCNTHARRIGVTTVSW